MKKNSQILKTVVVILVSMFFLNILKAQDKPKEAPKPVPKKYVFAHYMACLANGVTFGKQEIDLAQRHNIDGFALNSLTWGSWDGKNKKYKLGGHGLGANDMYQAAKELNSGFQLFVSADVNGPLGPLPQTMRDMVTRFKDHPNQFKHNGEVVLSSWIGTPMTYKGGCDLLEKEGIPICFVPYTSTSKFKMSRSIEDVENMFKGYPHMDGYFHFACDGTPNDLMRINATARRVTQNLDKIYMAGISPAYNSPNLRDMHGMEGYCAMWESLINDGADWVEIVTWNDYNEDSNLMPYRWRNGIQREYFNRDESFLDITGYFAAWFKSGQKPDIKQDKLYFTYRNRSRNLTKCWDYKNEKWVNIRSREWPFDQVHDDAEDFVYITAFLTKPAELQVKLGGKDDSFKLKQGIHHVRVPLKGGVPEFIISRDGKQLADVIGRKEIIDNPTKFNSPSGYHLLNRTWTNAVVIGKEKILDATKGTLNEGAVIVDVNGTKGVKNEEKEGSGFTVPLSSLQTSTYNIRVTYSNPTKEEARLTLFSDGPERREKSFPYYIPLFLPPTGKDQFKTISFLWSLYDKTTHLKVAWMPGIGGQNEENNPLHNDHGQVVISTIGLVKVDPITVPEPKEQKYPELVNIPGGSFTMGSDNSEPDEAPAHKVSISSFAIGKYEVTNEEYEKFDPKHREHRNGYSWRDREPVIYVKWTDAMNYCNWLSEQNNLKPAYVQKEYQIPDEKKYKQMQRNRERKIGQLKKQKKPVDNLPPLEKPMKTIKTLVIDPESDGFRLPTEAQWEYVASGRGEGRKYPWGNDTPVIGKHGNFTLEKSLAISPYRPSQEQTGVYVVGSFPDGASRDGVMDLAGNISEWCSDDFNPYTKEDQKDPCSAEESHYKSIRGGSWGYYGYSQRVTDREYNNKGYGGYIYVGFRVAIPEKGYQKLNAK